MARYEVTPELAETIKSVRIQNHVTAKSIAEHIGKSQSFISKLEKGDIKTIQERELTKIFRFIFGSDKGFQDFLNSALGKILDTLRLKYTDEDLSEQLWFDNYDTVLRLIPIPEELIDHLNTRLQSINLSIDELCARINANEGISPKVINTDQYPFNEWHPYIVNHEIEFSFIKMRVIASDIANILEKKTRTTNYVTILAIVYYIIKIEKYGSTIQISEEDNNLISREARDCLNRYKFYSIAEKRRLSKQAQSSEERDELLSSFDRENVSLVNEVLKYFRVFSEIDIANANKLLTGFVSNLKWDGGFMMRLSSMPFADIDDISFTIKKQMLSDIHDVVMKYKEIPEDQKRMEKYD